MNLLGDEYQKIIYDVAEPGFREADGNEIQDIINSLKNVKIPGRKK